MAGKEEIVRIRLDLKNTEAERFLIIKECLGLKNDTEVIARANKQVLERTSRRIPTKTRTLQPKLGRRSDSRPHFAARTDSPNLL
jgi:hypothetical protein